MATQVYSAQNTPGLSFRLAVLLCAATAAGAQDSALPRLAKAVDAQEKEKFQTSLEAYAGLEKQLPALTDYVFYGRGRALHFLGRKQEAISLLQKVAAMDTVSPLRSPAILLAGQGYLDLEQPAHAAEWIQPYLDQLPAGPALLIYGTSLKEAGFETAAAIQLQRLYYEFPLEAEATRAGTLLAELASALGENYPPVTGGSLLGRASKLINGGQTRQAITELNRALPSLGGLERDLARVRIGVALYRDNRNTDAYRYFRELSVESAEADAERVHHMMAAARRLNHITGAIGALEELNTRHASSPWRMESLVALGNHFLLSNDSDNYERYYTTCFDDFSQSPRASYCHWKVAWRHYLERRPTASSFLKNHIERFPDSPNGAAALYFLGRIEEDRGDPAAAQSYFSAVVSRSPNSYYATIARERLKARPLIKGIASAAARMILAQLPDPAAALNSDFTTDPHTKLRIDRARLLAAAGLHGMAEAELRFAARNGANANLIALELAQTAARRGANDQAIRYIKSVSPGYLNWEIDSTPDRFWRLAFPLPYRDLLEKHSQDRKLDPFLVAALIRQESEFDPKAVSRARAVGLTQVLPSTGREISRKLGIRYRPSMLTRPDSNLNLGTYYLKRLNESLQGQWETTLAAYNAGKSRALTWMQWGNFREPAEFIETIPFTETRDYVKTVLRNADIYRRLYAPPGRQSN